MTTLRVLIVLIAVALASCVGGGGGDLSPVTMDPSVSFDTLLNAYRADRGLSRLSKDSRLQAAAAAHARDLASRNALSHRGSDGSNHTVRAERTGYGPYVAENVAAGQDTPAEVMKAWMNSSGHRSNLSLNPASHYGFAHAVAPGTRYKDFWVLVVGRQYDREPRQPAPVMASSSGDWFDAQISTLGGLIGF